jgi:hypothetical protein
LTRSKEHKELHSVMTARQKDASFCLSRQRLCSKAIFLYRHRKWRVECIDYFLEESTEGQDLNFRRCVAGPKETASLCEQRAVEAGIYKARYGTVSLLSASQS